MTHGNMSWHEYGQIGLDQARDSLERQMKGTVEFEQRQNNDLKDKLKNTEEINQILRARIEKTENEALAYRELLSRPMKDIADHNGDFKKTYELQQQMLAEWIMGQKAFRETAKVLAEKAGVNEADFVEIQRNSINAVLTNTTEHGNDASTSPTLADYADTILAMRKKNGKA